MDKVTIVVPCYNCEKYIRTCLNSILCQTYANLEILLFDDGSKDSTLKILKKYEKSDSRIKVFSHSNKGVAFTRNLAIEKATGKYIMFIDNDDFVDENYVEEYVTKKGNFDIIVGGYRRVNINNEVVFKMSLLDCPWSKYIVTAPWAKLYRLKFLKENNIKFLENNIGEDVYFNLLAYSSTEKILTIDNTSYCWFINNASVSNTIQKNMDNNINFLYLLNRIYDELKERDLLDNYFLETYFTRYIVWYLLYASKKSSFSKIKNEHKELFNWLRTRYPDYLHNKEISFKKPSGETFKNRFIVKMYLLLHKFYCDRLFLYVYSRI